MCFYLTFNILVLLRRKDQFPWKAHFLFYNNWNINLIKLQKPFNKDFQHQQFTPNRIIETTSRRYRYNSRTYCKNLAAPPRSINQDEKSIISRNFPVLKQNLLFIYGTHDNFKFSSNNFHNTHNTHNFSIWPTFWGKTLDGILKFSFAGTNNSSIAANFTTLKNAKPLEG